MEIKIGQNSPPRGMELPERQIPSGPQLARALNLVVSQIEKLESDEVAFEIAQASLNVDLVSLQVTIGVSCRG